MNQLVRPAAVTCRRLTVFAVISAWTWAAAPITSQAAPVDAPSASCRAAIAKGVSRLANTTMKAFDGCVKAALKGDSVDCTDHLTADLSVKIPTVQAKLSAAISASCDDT